jgi:ABC-2 type transport system ATP-binding protein
MIDIDNVSKTYGSKVALQNLTLQVDRGELFAFLGPNGAGKTTTIKLMCGLLFPSTGTIRISGFDLHKQGRQARQLISYVPDQPFLYEKLTGREILHFITEMYGMDKTLARQRIDEVIDTFELKEFVDDLTQHYSHGMRQRTVFASALVHDPQVLIVDEPTVGLDPRSIRLLKDLLRQEAKKGVTVFLSTHSLDIAQELADQIGVIHNGKLIGHGSLETLQKQTQMDGNLEEVFLKLTEEQSQESPSPGDAAALVSEAIKVPKP